MTGRGKMEGRDWRGTAVKMLNMTSNTTDEHTMPIRFMQIQYLLDIKFTKHNIFNINNHRVTNYVSPGLCPKKSSPICPYDGWKISSLAPEVTANTIGSSLLEEC